MFGRLGWLEILIIVVLVVILFGSSKIPGMMKNLADGVNTFRKEMKSKKGDKAATDVEFAPACVAKPAAKKAVKKPAAKKAAPKKKAATKK